MRAFMGDDARKQPGKLQDLMLQFVVQLGKFVVQLTLGRFVVQLGRFVVQQGIFVVQLRRYETAVSWMRRQYLVLSQVHST